MQDRFDRRQALTLALGALALFSHLPAVAQEAAPKTRAEVRSEAASAGSAKGSLPAGASVSLRGRARQTPQKRRKRVRLWIGRIAILRTCRLPILRPPSLSQLRPIPA